MNPYWIKNEDSGQPSFHVREGKTGSLMTLEHYDAPEWMQALTPAETEEWGLRDESLCCEINGLTFVSFPIEDRSVPTPLSEFDGLIASVTDYLREGKAGVVHCWGGVGRSSVIAACALIRNGLSADDAFRVIEEARGRQVPDTAEQRQWVEIYSSRFGSVGK